MPFAKLELIDRLSCESLAQASRTLQSPRTRARRGDCARKGAKGALRVSKNQLFYAFYSVYKT